MNTQATPSNLLPDDVLTAIFAVAKKTTADRLAFRGHDSALQGIFRDIKEKLDSPLLKDFVFSDSGPEPYSPALSEAISRLQLCGLVGRENPDYEVVFLNRSAELYFEEELRNRLSAEELSHLDMIAQEFLKRIQRG